MTSLHCVEACNPMPFLQWRHDRSKSHLNPSQALVSNSVDIQIVRMSKQLSVHSPCEMCVCCPYVLFGLIQLWFGTRTKIMFLWLIDAEAIDIMNSYYLHSGFSRFRSLKPVLAWYTSHPTEMRRGLQWRKNKSVEFRRCSIEQLANISKLHNKESGRTSGLGWASKLAYCQRSLPLTGTSSQSKTCLSMATWTRRTGDAVGACWDFNRQQSEVFHQLEAFHDCNNEKKWIGWVLVFVAHGLSEHDLVKKNYRLPQERAKPRPNAIKTSTWWADLMCLQPGCALSFYLQAK